MSNARFMCHLPCRGHWMCCVSKRRNRSLVNAQECHCFSNEAKVLETEMPRETNSPGKKERARGARQASTPLPIVDGER
jgi:hypothetical protein